MSFVLPAARGAIDFVLLQVGQVEGLKPRNPERAKRFEDDTIRKENDAEQAKRKEVRPSSVTPRR